MAENSAIEWTDSTVNFWWGCTKVGPGCDHCYAEAWAKRTGLAWGLGTARRQIKSAVKLLYKLHNGASWWAADHYIGKFVATPRRRVFIQSMSDLFDTEVPIEWLSEAWQHICACDALAIQIVTKRISVVEKRLASINAAWPAHAGLMVSIVDQSEADRDIPRLIALKKAIGIPWIGLSMEPLLGAVVLRDEWLAALDWIIVGGESGAHARPMHPDWARSLRDQCAAASVPFLFKQWGEYAPYDGGARDGAWLDPDGHFYGGPTNWPPEAGERCRFMCRVGKKAAGRLLDGVQHDGIPKTTEVAR